MKRVAIIGCGSIAGVHASALLALKDVTIVAFADIRRERAEDFSKRYTDGRASVYETLSALLASEAVDVIHICTPHYLHVPMAIEALSHGVSFFSEKPPAINMEQFEELFEVHKRNRELRTGFCFQNRYNLTIKKAEELIKTRQLGDVIGARAFVTWRRDAAYYVTDWKGRLATEGGGALMNQSIHTLDLLLQFLGNPEEVRASLSNHHLQGVIEVEDTVEAWLSFSGNRRASFYATTAYVMDAPVILELQCERGSITIINQSVSVTINGETKTYNVQEAEAPGKDYWGSGHLRCIADFYKTMETGERFRNDLEGVRNTMETTMKIYQYG